MCIFDLIVFLIFIGMVLFNSGICKYFYTEIPESACRKKIYVYAMAVFGILSAVLFPLSLLVHGNAAAYVASGCILLFTGFISRCECLIRSKNAKYPLWLSGLTLVDKIFLAIVAVVFFACLAEFNFSLKRILPLLYFYVFLTYLFFLKKMREKHKILPLFSRKYPDLCVKLMQNTFYFAGLAVAVISVVSIGLELVAGSDAADCIESGLCKEGYVFDDCGDGKPCTVNKDFCLKNNYVWQEDLHICDINHNSRDKIK